MQTSALDAAVACVDHELLEQFDFPDEIATKIFPRVYE